MKEISLHRPDNKVTAFSAAVKEAVFLEDMRSESLAKKNPKAVHSRQFSKDFIFPGPY